MSGSSPILWLWPGLSGLVRFGRGVFLILAVGFGLLVSTVLFCCGFWTELIAPESKLGLLLGLLGVHFILSLVSAALSAHFSGQLAYDEEGDRFLLALNAYLSGDWAGTEKIARAILRRNKRDPDILLLLATLCRHTERYDEAALWLDRLAALESAEKWSCEIETERAELAEALAENRRPESIPFPNRRCGDQPAEQRRRAVGE